MYDLDISANNFLTKTSLNMTRLDFLKSVGFGGASLMAVLASCQKSSIAPAPTNVDFTLDLTATANATLKNSGGYVVMNGLVVARTSSGTYVAASHTCTHEGSQKVIFSAGEFYCTEHGARFSTTGQGLNSYGSNGLTVYKTQQTDTNTLRVYS